MSLEEKLRRQPPHDLSGARTIAHKAVQLISQAARANLSAEPDDSQANLGWDAGEGRFLSRPVAADGGTFIFVVALSLAPLRLSLLRGSELVASLSLDGHSVDDATNWLDARLQAVGLNPASTVAIPYELPPEVIALDGFRPAEEANGLAALAAWFDLAHGMLSTFAADKAKLTPGPVRCWPHHFDIATYVDLEAGDAESAKGIGVGLSPGDGAYDQPYFYINPWPHPDPASLPVLLAPGHWHTEGFVGAIATAEEVLSLDGIAARLPVFISGAFALGREILGA
ncbi:MAG: hypothetical protein QF582_02535 [Alphaproteobacteria bacterium]|nr:hypothetical protein [Alphaproteobacteria bacterium]